MKKLTVGLAILTAALGLEKGMTAQAVENTEVLLETTPQVDSEQTQADYDYDVKLDGTISIDRYMGSSARVIIPNEIDGKPVTEIGYGAFLLNEELQSVVIPSNVAVIDSMAFAMCANLTDIAVLNPDCTIYDNKQTLAAAAKIYGYKDSTAESYAAKYEKAFVEVPLNGFGYFENQLMYWNNGMFDTSLYGLVSYNGAWFYLENGALQTGKNGFVDYQGGTFLVAGGQVADYYSGLVQMEDGWYYLADGMLQKQYSGFASYDGEWFYIKEGKLAEDMNGLYTYNGGKFLIAAGRVLYSYSGLFQNTDNQWYYIASGQVQDQYTGLASYDNEWFYLKNGIMDIGYTGICEYAGADFLVNCGQVMSSYTGSYDCGENRFSVVAGQIKNKIPRTHSKEEIRSFYQRKPFDMEQAITYAVAPEVVGAVSGSLSPNALRDGVNTINLMRYIAGMPADVAITSEYARYAQDAAFVLALNGEGLSHSPTNKNNIPEELYESACKGASYSNLGMGYRNISHSIITGYMNDGDTKNIDKVGHRRWILSPALQYTGFGYYDGYTATYALDNTRSDYEIDYVAWPAENMPSEVFYGPWSLHLSADAFTYTENVNVVMTNLSTEASWVFNEQTNNDTKLKPYFNWQDTAYGYMNALVFDPGVEFGTNDSVQITVTGLLNAEGVETSISYVVNFFSLYEE